MSWIKCSERMPDWNKPVLVYGPFLRRSYRVGNAITGAVWDGDGWDLQGAEGWEWEMTVQPTHWQPLPEPPNE